MQPDPVHTAAYRTNDKDSDTAIMAAWLESTADADGLAGTFSLGSEPKRSLPLRAASPYLTQSLVSSSLAAPASAAALAEPLIKCGVPDAEPVALGAEPDAELDAKPADTVGGIRIFQVQDITLIGCLGTGGMGKVRALSRVQPEPNPSLYY